MTPERPDQPLPGPTDLPDQPLPGPTDLPDLVIVTDRVAATAGRGSLERVVDDLAGLERTWVLFREKDLAADDRRELGALVRAAADRGGLSLLVASDADLAADLGAVGVHLAAADPPLEAPGVLVGRSCHDRAELVGATGVDLVTLSPVHPTASKPGHGPALGVAGLAELVAGTGPPVYALGGLEPGLVGPCIAAGARGAAVMGAVMRASRPREVAVDLLDELAAARSSVSA